MAVAWLVEQGGTSAGHLQAGHFAPVPGTGSIEEKPKRDEKYLGNAWVIIRFLVPREGRAVMLRWPRVFHYHLAKI